MSISDKIKSIVTDVVDQVLDAVNEEFRTALQDALASIKTGALPLHTRTPVPREAVESAVRGHKLCRQEGCSGVAVPRYRNFCKDHKDLALLEGKAIKKRKARKKRRKAAKQKA